MDSAAGAAVPPWLSSNWRFGTPGWTRGGGTPSRPGSRLRSTRRPRASLASRRPTGRTICGRHSARAASRSALAGAWAQRPLGGSPGRPRASGDPPMDLPFRLSLFRSQLPARTVVSPEGAGRSRDPLRQKEAPVHGHPKGRRPARHRCRWARTHCRCQLIPYRPGGPSGTSAGREGAAADTTLPAALRSAGVD